MKKAVAPAKITVLVVDDSAHNRRSISQMLESAEDVEVVGYASDGEEALKKALLLQPDAITLDLEMPKLDGFAFLRLLMANAAIPVIVISSYAHKADVFKALALGAFDFLAKPKRAGKDALDLLRTELLAKVRAARDARPASAAKDRPDDPERRPFIVAVGASTGGPPAIQRILESLRTARSACVLVSQHMPPGFTRAFAERLDRLGPFAVREAEDGDAPSPGTAFIAPGGKHLMLAKRRTRLELRVSSPAPDDKHAPSVDRLFESVAEVLGDRAIGVVLTGMGSDGAAGAKAIARAGGEVWAESHETAVVNGMPKEAIASGAVKRVLALGDIGPALAEISSGRTRRLSHLWSWLGPRGRS